MKPHTSKAHHQDLPWRKKRCAQANPPNNSLASSQQRVGAAAPWVQRAIRAAEKRLDQRQALDAYSELKNIWTPTRWHGLRLGFTKRRGSSSRSHCTVTLQVPAADWNQRRNLHRQSATGCRHPAALRLLSTNLRSPGRRAQRKSCERKGRAWTLPGDNHSRSHSRSRPNRQTAEKNRHVPCMRGAR